MLSRRHHIQIWWWACVLLVLFSWVEILVFYPVHITTSETVYAFTTDNNKLYRAIIVNLRLPRLFVAVMLGANIAFAGALLQAVTRNPLASPSVLSINSGAGLAMVVATVLDPAFLSSYQVAFIASVGGFITWVIVILISKNWQHNAQDRGRMVLAGIAVSLFCAALSKMLIIIAEDQAYNIVNWLAGDIAHSRMSQAKILLPFFVFAIGFYILFAHKLNLLSLSDDAARALGVQLTRLRWYVNILVALLVGSAVSVAGPIAFIGLLVPHFSRFIVGYDLRYMLPMCMLLGSVLMLLADTLARAVKFPSEIPAGALLALIGAPVFVLLARKKM